MAVETDDRGRLYLPKDLREKHGERFRVLDLPSRVILIPIDDDPLEAAREAMSDRFAGRSLEAIREDILEAAVNETDTESTERNERQQNSAGE